jgi:CitB family two-component system sensor histidine kinase MalK
MIWAKPAIRLRTRITLLVCAILALVLVVTGLMVTWRVERQTRELLTAKAVMVSQLVAESGPVVEALKGNRPRPGLQVFAERMRETTQVDFIVVLDMHHNRLSHPTASIIGAPFVGGDEAAVFRGLAYTSYARGTLGRSMRAFTPVRDPATGEQIGAVAVGILVKGLDQTAAGIRKWVLLGILAGFLAGIPAAVYVAGRIKRILLGMEPVEIATLLQQRHALLNSVREGVVAVDRELRITIVNEEAARLFERAGIHGDLLGRPLDEVLPRTGMREVLASGQAEFDQEFPLNDLPVVASRVPVVVGGTITGVVATFRDKTELHQLTEQLTGIRVYAEALRAQTHEFMNKLHVILGLIRLREYERLGAYITGITGRLQEDAGFVIQRIKDPVVAGFLLARFSAAREQKVQLRLADDSFVPSGLREDLVHAVVTILGNLLENAMESVAGLPDREILVFVGLDEEDLRITVEDSGPGLAPDIQDKLFLRGFSTKGEHRGYGLFHCAQSVAALGGKLTASNREQGGAAFTAAIRFPVEEQA